MALICYLKVILFSFPVQVWFQNRRARTLKCKGTKKTLWQADSPPHDELPAPHAAARRASQALQRPPPAYPMQLKEETKPSCYYGQYPPAYPAPEKNSHYGSVFGLQQGRQLGSHSGPALKGLWSQPGGQTAPMPPLWCQSPLQTDKCGLNPGQAGLLYPASAEQMYLPHPASHSSTPDTPDSGFWDTRMESSPPTDGQYLHLEDSWSGMAPGDCRDPGQAAPLMQHAPLPELSLQDILGELDEEWLAGEEPGSQASADPVDFCQ